MKIAHLIAMVCLCVTGFAQINCANDSTGLIPLVDLKENYYMGSQGGLYPEGKNVIPLSHQEPGEAIGDDILPLDTAGLVDTLGGLIVFVGMGPSLPGNTMNKFISKVNSNEYVNPCVVPINGCWGGKGLETMIDDSIYWYWEGVNSKLDSAGITPAQVQVIWIQTTSKTDTVISWPAYPDTLKERFIVAIGLMKDEYPNLKLLYLTGMHYGGYADPTHELYKVVSEPASYYNNFAIKWAIEEQISGTDPRLTYTGADPAAPWIGWGPNFWADGKNPRELDGLKFLCPEDMEDGGGGFHLSDSGLEKESTMLINFLSTNKTSKQWFLKSDKWHCADSIVIPEDTTTTDTTTTAFINIETTEMFAIHSNVIHDEMTLTAMNEMTNVNCVLYDLQGRVVSSHAISHAYKGELVMMQFSDVSSGIYVLQIYSSNSRQASKFYIE